MTKSRRWARRSLVALALVAILVILWILLGAKNYTVPITSYRIVDDRTIVVQVVAGSRSWCRVTDEVESTSDVRISAECLDWLPLPGTAVGQTVDLTVHLDQPLSDRLVMDGAGMPIALQKCTDNVCAEPGAGLRLSRFARR